jgi:hypothetical protein
VIQPTFREKVVMKVLQPAHAASLVANHVISPAVVREVPSRRLVREHPAPPVHGVHDLRRAV